MTQVSAVSPLRLVIARATRPSKVSSQLGPWWVFSALSPRPENTAQRSPLDLRLRKRPEEVRDFHNEHSPLYFPTEVPTCDDRLNKSMCVIVCLASMFVACWSRQVSFVCLLETLSCQLCALVELLYSIYRVCGVLLNDTDASHQVARNQPICVARLIDGNLYID